MPAHGRAKQESAGCHGERLALLVDEYQRTPSGVCQAGTVAQTPRNPHTVSRVVLSQFTLRSEMRIYDRNLNRLSTRGTRKIYVYPGFDSHQPQASEDRWQTFERRMNDAYRAIRSHRAFEDDSIVELLRDILALHWARSPATKLVHERIKGEVSQTQQQRLEQNPSLMQAFFVHETGLAPAGYGAIQWAAERLATFPAGVAEELFSSRNQVMFERAQAKFSQAAIQIGMAPSGSLLIGDAPVITRINDGEGLGPHQGVALYEATYVAMPIAPDIVISLGPDPMDVRLDTNHVKALNSLQAGSFIRWLGAKPQSTAAAALEGLVPFGTRLVT